MSNKHFNIEQFNKQLAQFRGGGQTYFHPMFKQYIYTEGVQFVAREAGAYWLVEHIFIYQTEPVIAREEFQVWIIKVENSKAIITVDDGNGKIVRTFKIPYTDFPLAEFKFYFTNNTLLLPSEY